MVQSAVINRGHGYGRLTVWTVLTVQRGHLCFAFKPTGTNVRQSPSHPAHKSQKSLLTNQKYAQLIANFLLWTLLI